MALTVFRSARLTTARFPSFLLRLDDFLVRMWLLYALLWIIFFLAVTLNLLRAPR
jgi:type II secretory pathway component PulF